MLKSQRLMVEQSEKRERINALLSVDEMGEEERGELAPLTKRAQEIEVELRAALVVEGQQPETRVFEPDTERRERLDLRGRASLTNYLMAAAQGRMPAGAELELQQAAGVSGVPIELFERRQDLEALERRVDAATTAPSTGTGLNVDPIIPAIYARSVANRIGIAMPRVSSGGYSTMTISAGLSAAAVAAGAPKESTAATLTPKQTAPHRISARLSLRIEDVALVGVENYESSLRQNLMLALSDQLDAYALTGDGQNANPQGLMPQLTDPTDPTAVVDFDGFVAAVAGGVDGGPWAESMSAITLVVNAETMRLAETVFQTSTSYKGELSAASYLRTHAMGFFSSRRMPATATMIAQALRYRSGTMGMNGVDAMRVAVIPTWAEIGIDDPYTDSASGTRHYTLHTLCGDCLITQPDAFERVDLKIA